LRAAVAGIPSRELRRRLGRTPVYHLSVSLVTVDRMRELNRRYRGKDRPTDVLSFGQLENGPAPSPEGNIGDLVLCPALARRQAPAWNATPLQEIKRLTVHGLLHLFGYDHETNERDARRMFRLQERILEPIL